MTATLYPDPSELQPLNYESTDAFIWRHTVIMSRNDNNDPAMTKAHAIKGRIKDAMRKWRAAKQYSQAEAAGILGISRRTYEKYEGDPGRGIPYHVLAQFCLVAEVDTDWLLLGKKRRKTAPPAMPVLVKAAQKIKIIA